MTIEFKEPPKGYRRKHNFDWDKITAALQENPTKWALLGEGIRLSIATAINQRKIGNFHPDQGIEVTTADNRQEGGSRVCDIFVRYNPEGDTRLTKKEAAKAVAEAKRKNGDK
jgi:hypothetical protein